MKKLLILFIPFLWSCTTVIDLDVDDPPSNTVVIQGILTDSFTNNLISVSRGLGINDSPEFTGQSADTVYVVELDPSGQFIRSIPYIEILGDSLPGVYLSQIPFAGQIDHFYQLHVRVMGEDYFAEERMLRVAPMDSLVVRIDEEERQNPGEEGEYYEVLLYAKEPPETIDYYMWNFYKNDTLENNDGRAFYYADDKLIQESINGFPAPLYYAEDDTFQIEMFSLSRSTFLYIADLDAAINNDGGMFSPPPANPRGNISNGAFGVWQVSDVSRGRGVIKAP